MQPKKCNVQMFMHTNVEDKCTKHNTNYCQLFAAHARAGSTGWLLPHMSTIVMYVHAHIYIEDMRTKKVNECAVASERSVFS